jgi:hypothetical protein
MIGYLFNRKREREREREREIAMVAPRKASPPLA